MSEKKIKHSLTYAWFICLLAALFYSYDFMLRVAPSIMVGPLQNTFHITTTTVAFISVFYYYAYTPMQIPTGYLVDKYGCRHTISLAILLCGLSSLLFAHTSNLYILYLSRFLMGLGSAFGYVGALKLAGIWLPHNQFALFTGVATAMGLAGGLSADNIMSYLVVHWGWREASDTIGYLGIILGILFFLLVKDRPAGSKKPSPHYYSLTNNMKRVYFLLKNWRFWMLGIVGALLFMPLSVFAALWAPSFIHAAYDVSIIRAAQYTSFLFIGAIIGNPFIGYLSDKVKSRKKPIICGGFFALILITTIIYLPLPHELLILVLFLLGICVSTQTLVFPLAKEISPPKTTGTSSSVTNFMVTLSALFFQPIIGYFLTASKGTSTTDTTQLHSVHNYRMALLIIPILLLISLIASFFIPATGAKPRYKSMADFKKKNK